MNIEGLGEALVAQLLQHNLVHSVADIYGLTEAQLLSLERIGKKTADALLAEIAKSRSAPLARVLYGLGIRFVGERTAELLAAHFGSMNALMDASREDLEQVNEIGPRVSESICEFFSEAPNRQLVEDLRAAGLQFTAQKREPYRRPAYPYPRAGQGENRIRRRQSFRHSQQEDKLCRRRGRSRL